MKKQLLLSALLILTVFSISCVAPPSFTNPESLGEGLFKAIKNNDLKEFKSYFITYNELDNCYYNKSVNISWNDHWEGIENYKKEITDAYYSKYLDRLREHEDFDWNNAVYETTEVNIRKENYADVHMLTILFLVNGERKRIDGIKAMKIKMGLNGQDGEKFVIGDF